MSDDNNDKIAIDVKFSYPFHYKTVTPSASAAVIVAFICKGSDVLVLSLLAAYIFTGLIIIGFYALRMKYQLLQQIRRGNIQIRDNKKEEKKRNKRLVKKSK